MAVKEVDLGLVTGPAGPQGPQGKLANRADWCGRESGDH